MRIDLNNSLAQQIAAERSAQKNAAPPEQAPAPATSGEDKASFSKASLSLPALIQSALKPPTTREERVAALREVVSNGRYKVDTSSVAESMLTEAGY
jgi:flagellar biosynthesis anti-sigma factor FlgM